MSPNPSRQATKAFSVRNLLARFLRDFRENRPLQILSWVLPLAFFAFLAWRQHHFVDRYSVNMMFWDQWDFYIPFFEHGDAWAVFTRQHGPHRQGVGFLLTELLANLSHWNTRWDAFATSYVLMAAALTGAWVAVKCGCRMRITLPVIALVFFNLRQYETFVSATNLSHGAVPVLLLMIYALSWFVASAPARLLLISALTFLLIFTGFGIFAGLLTPVLVVVEAVHAFKARRNCHACWALVALALTAVSWWAFSRGYRFAPAVDNFQFPHPRPWEYLWFIGEMFANFDGISGPKMLSIGGGLLIAIGLGTLCVRHGWRLVRHGPVGRAPDVIIVFFAAFALLYCANTAVGRISLGYTGAARASRYVTLLIPAALALYIGLVRLFPRRDFAVGVIYAAALAAGTLALKPADWRSIRWFHDGRSAWKRAYLETHDELQANERSQFPVYPIPGQITARLKYLEENRLNLFAPDN